MKQVYALICICLIGLLACEEEKTFSLVPSLGFLQNEGSITQTEAGGTRIRFYSNVKITEPVAVQVGISNIDGLTYGEDYTTDPAPENNIITVIIDPEDEQPSFFFLPIETGTEDNKRLNFQVLAVEGNGLRLGQPVSLTYALTIKGFEEIVPVTITHDFNGCTTDFSTPAGFIEVFEPGSKTDRGWGCRNFGRGPSRAPRASAFGGSNGEDRAWMVMNPVAVGSGATVTINFWTYSQFAGPGKISVKWSNTYSGSGDPLAATWTTLSSLDAQFPAANSLTWTNVTGSFNNISGASVYFAFVYTEGLSGGSTAYDIDDLTIKVE